MMIAAVTPAELRSALANLAMRSASFARGRGRDQARGQLLAAITSANQALSAADAPNGLRDAQELVAAYIAVGGDWHQLVAAVNRAALEGATRRAG